MTREYQICMLYYGHLVDFNFPDHHKTKCFSAAMTSLVSVLHFIHCFRKLVFSAYIHLQKTDYYTNYDD